MSTCLRGYARLALKGDLMPKSAKMVLNEVMDDLHVLFVPTEVPKKTKKEANHTTPIGYRACALGPQIVIRCHTRGSSAQVFFIYFFKVLNN